MNYKKLIVSPDNKLVLEDYNLNSGNSEILDLNKSLQDIISDGELEVFIKENIVNPSKVYLVCVKENFQSNDQRIENIPNVKKVYKQLKKMFKKYSNVFFFVYNTYAKSEELFENKFNNESDDIYEQNTYMEEPYGENSDEYSESNHIITHEDNNLSVIDNEQKETLQEYSDMHQDESQFGESSEYHNTNDVESSGSNGNVETENYEETYNDGDTEETQKAVKNDVISQNDDIELNFNEFDEATSIDEPQDNVVLDAEISNSGSKDKEWFGLESSNNIFQGQQLVSNQVDSPYKEEITRFNDFNTSTSNDDISNSNEIEIPESYFDDENEEQISYEDYQEFQNDYELNVHALKSIYDFVWRMLILNNYNLKINDLLYLSVNNLHAFSVGQSDFVRQIANKSESLFDLILQLDIKLEFNNSLFYIYLAELFTISANRISVNRNFLNTLSIWINKNSKDKFITQVEQFINYSNVYNKKIIFAYFVELANYIKGIIPSISTSLNLVDIHRILVSPTKRIRQENVFGFMVLKMNEIFKKNSIIIESVIADMPENMFSNNKEKYLDDVELNWKSKLSVLYKQVLENIRNYILSKGNNETTIFNLYVDIRDLRMYKGEQFVDSPLSLDVSQAFNNGDNYLTIGDAFDRTPSIVPSQVSNEEFNHQNSYANIPTATYYTENNNINTITNNVNPVETPKYPIRFNTIELEDSMTKRIEEYERKIKENIARIEAERKSLREKMEVLKSL